MNNSFPTGASTSGEPESTIFHQPTVANDNTPPLLIRFVRAPAGLSRNEAAGYVGVSPVAFDSLIASGLMPPPLPLGIRRRVWNIRALDFALDRLAGIERSIQAQVVKSEQEAPNKLLEMLGHDPD